MTFIVSTFDARTNLITYHKLTYFTNVDTFKEIQTLVFIRFGFFLIATTFQILDEKSVIVIHIPF